TASIFINSSGLLDLNNYSGVISTVQLVEGPVSSAQITTGTGILTLGGGVLTTASATVVTLQVLGAGNSTGATISGNLALDAYNYASTTPTRTFVVNHGAAAVDLNVSAAISDGTGLVNTNLYKYGFGTLELSGNTSNTYSGTTEVVEGTLLLGKTGGALAIGGALTVGDGSLASGGVDSDVVRLEGDNQLPSAMAPVLVNATGLLDLNGHTLTIGSQPGTTALTINSGDVLDSGTIILNGELSVTDVNAPAQIRGTGNLNLGSAPRTFTFNHSTFNYTDDLIISANITGSSAADLTKAGTGYLELTGDNTYAGRTYLSAGGITIGGSNAFGTGNVYLGSNAGSVYVMADNGPQTVSNPVFMGDIVQFGALGTADSADSLTFTGAANLTPYSSVTSTSNTMTVYVNNPSIITFSGGVGDFEGSEALTKNGTGFLVLSGDNTYSGATIINDGSIVLSGGGMLANSVSLSVASGGTLELDNGPGIDGSAGENLADRINDAATLLLNGGTFYFVGASGAASSETLSTITINTNQFTATTQTESTINLQVDPNVAGSSVTVTADALVPGATGTPASTTPAGVPIGDTLNLVGAGAQVGTANNRLLLNTAPLLVSGLLPWITLTSPTTSTVDFATTAIAGSQTSIQAPSETPLSSGTTLTSAADSGANLKLAGPGTYTLGANISINSLELTAGATLNTNGYTLTVTSGELISEGTGNAITDSSGGQTGVLNLGAAEGLIFTDSPLLLVPTAIPNLTISAQVSSSTTIRKERGGTLVLSGNNLGITGSVYVDQGVLSVQNSNALGDTRSSEVQTLTLLNATGGTFTLSFNGATTPALSFKSTAAQIQTALANLTTVSPGSITVTSNTPNGTLFTFYFGAGFAGTAQPMITVASLLTGGAGPFAPVAIMGRISAGAVGALVANNAALDLSGGVTIGVPLSMIGSGIAGTGAILNVSGNNFLISTVDVRSTTTVAVTNTLGVASGTLEIDGSVTTSANTGIAGTGTGIIANGLTKVGPGTLVLGGSLGNAIFGTTTVNEGTLVLDKAPGVPALSGALTIGDNVGIGTDTVLIESPEQLAQTSVVTINATGALDLMPSMVSSATNETQVVSVTNNGQIVNVSGSAGTFTLTINGQTTTAIAYNATTATVQTALQTLTSIGTGNVVVTGSAGAYLVTFQGALALATQPLMVAAGSAGASAAVSETIGTFTLSFNGQTTGSLPYFATTAQVLAALEQLSSIPAGSVSVSGEAGEYAVSFVGSLAGATQSMMTVAVSNGASYSIAESTVGSASSNLVTNTTQLVNVGLVSGTFTLTYGGTATGNIPYNATPAQVQAALYNLSTINGGTGNSNVIVGGAPGEYTVTFVGSLAGKNVALMTANTTSVTLTLITVGGQNDSETIGNLSMVDGSVASSQIGLGTG
ncbi:MAG TPA: autotransporter-associated beta strand repeat-containing protein, partial [Pirellulales bacterium]